MSDGWAGARIDGRESSTNGVVKMLDTVVLLFAADGMTVDGDLGCLESGAGGCDGGGAGVFAVAVDSRYSSLFAVFRFAVVFERLGAVVVG